MYGGVGYIHVNAGVHRLEPSNLLELRYGSGCWKSNSGPLQEQYVLIITDSFLQLPEEM